MKLNIGPQPDEERSQDFEHNGFKFKLKAYDPYGFVRVVSLTGNKTIPGEYTSFGEARRGAIDYVLKNLLPSKEEKEKKV